MEGLNFDDFMDYEVPRARAARSKPVKRKWREIEAIKDRQRLKKELMDMDIGFDDVESIEY
ncbi:DUF3545 family protein [Vibrio scophthalmi]|uniref:DUF3545 family protein n=1 Tax=Vibrio scophthalmi TaxID=45658 RepID=UPI002FF32A80